jgi:hypothetical protein
MGLFFAWGRREYWNTGILEYWNTGILGRVGEGKGKIFDSKEVMINISPP